MAVFFFFSVSKLLQSHHGDTAVAKKLFQFQLHCFLLKRFVLNLHQVQDGKWSQKEPSCRLANSDPARLMVFAKSQTV